MDESYCMTNTPFYVGMLSHAGSPAQSCMQSSSVLRSHAVLREYLQEQLQEYDVERSVSTHL
jgi:hypothetical protein